MIVKILLLSLTSVLITILTTPYIKKIALKYNILDHPNNRKVHKKPIPQLGGLSIYLAFLINTLLFNENHTLQITLIIGATLILIIGLIDDIKEIRAIVKFIAQLFVAYLTWEMGIKISIISNPFGGILNTSILSLPITMLWIVSLINAINLIDGIDGLATGITAIASLILSIIALTTGQWMAACLSATLFGSCLGFLKYNFFPAKMFLGDSGAMLLGYLLATISITGVLKSTLTFAVLLPILILAIPLFDTSLSIVRRIKNKQNIFKPDKNHLHHILLSKGYSVKEISYGGYIISSLLGIFAINLSFFKGLYANILYSLIGLTLISITIYILTKKSPKKKPLLKYSPIKTIKEKKIEKIKK